MDSHLSAEIRALDAEAGFIDGSRTSAPLAKPR
jgi:hypothetical protein